MRSTEQWGSVPFAEDCAQVGSDDYYEKGRAECKRLIRGLTRKFGEPPIGMYYKTFANPHDFGTYYQVGVVYDDENEKHLAYLERVDGEFPETWDEIEKGDT